MQKNVQIIVIPGIMGSVLKKNNSHLWPHTNYIPGVYDSLKEIKNRDIQPTKIESTTYKALINHLKTLTPNVTEFFYDWRQNNLQHLSLLEEKINEDVDEIIIVAHSMGGIIGKLFLNHFKESEFINKINTFITLGTPWNGAMDAYRTLKYGKSIPEKRIIRGLILNDKTSKEISLYFPSVYQLLPSRKYCKASERTEEKVLVSYRINQKNYYDHDEFFQDHLKEMFESAGHKYLEVFEDFYNLLDQSLLSHIKHYEIIGLGQPTIAGITENSLGEAEGDFRNGDGTVPLFSAFTNAEQAFFVDKVGHQDLPKDEGVLNLITDIIQKIDLENIVETESIFKTLDSKYNKGFTGQIIKIACPVTVSLTNNDGEVIYGAIETIDEDGLLDLIQYDYNVQQIGTTTYIYMDESENDTDKYEKIIIQAYDQGPTNVTIDQYDLGRYVKRSSFKSFEINTQIKAELTLSSNIEDCQLIIDEEGKEPYSSPASINEITDEIKLPVTKANISGTHTLQINENTYLVKGDVYFNLLSIEQNQYDIDNTFIKIDNGSSEKIIDLDGNTNFLLGLEEGSYSIEYFSKDIFGNVEAANTIRVIILPKNSLNVQFEFYPHQYVVNGIITQKYLELVSEFPHEDQLVQIIFDNDKNVVGNNVFYGANQRKMTVKYHNILDEVEEYNLLIDEDIVHQIYEGTATEQNLKDFMNNLMLTNASTRFNMPEGNPKKKITNENISICNEIIVHNEIVNVRIIKNKNYDVSFQNLAEDIIIDKKGFYPLLFKVLIKGQNSEVKSLNLEFFGKLFINDDVIPLKNNTVVFDQETNVYVANIDLNEVNGKMRDYWRTNEIVLYEVNIVDRENNMNVIRTQNIFLRK